MNHCQSLDAIWTIMTNWYRVIVGGMPCLRGIFTLTVFSGSDFIPFYGIKSYSVRCYHSFRFYCIKWDQIRSTVILASRVDEWLLVVIQGFCPEVSQSWKSDKKLMRYYFSWKLTKTSPKMGNDKIITGFERNNGLTFINCKFFW